MNLETLARLDEALSRWALVVDHAAGRVYMLRKDEEDNNVSTLDRANAKRLEPDEP